MGNESVAERAGRLVGRCKRDRLFFSQVFISLVSLSMMVFVSSLYVGLLLLLEVGGGGSTDDMGTGLFFFFVIVPVAAYAFVGFLLSAVLIPRLRSRHELSVEAGEDTSRKRRRSTTAKSVTFVFMLPALTLLGAIAALSLQSIADGADRIPYFVASSVIAGFLLLFVLAVIKKI